MQCHVIAAGRVLRSPMEGLQRSAASLPGTATHAGPRPPLSARCLNIMEADTVALGAVFAPPPKVSPEVASDSLNSR